MNDETTSKVVELSDDEMDDVAGGRSLLLFGQESSPEWGAWACTHRFVNVKSFKTFFNSSDCPDFRPAKDCMTRT